MEEEYINPFKKMKEKSKRNKENKIPTIPKVKITQKEYETFLFMYEEIKDHQSNGRPDDLPYSEEEMKNVEKLKNKMSKLCKNKIKDV